jgi:hypothetical protein
MTLYPPHLRIVKSFIHLSLDNLNELCHLGDSMQKPSRNNSLLTPSGHSKRPSVWILCCHHCSYYDGLDRAPTLADLPCSRSESFNFTFAHLFRSSFGITAYVAIPWTKHIKLSHSRPRLFLLPSVTIAQFISSFQTHNHTDQNARDTLVRYCNNRRRPRWPPPVSSTIKMGLQRQTHRQPTCAHSDRTSRWYTTAIFRDLEKHGLETKDHGLRSCPSF